MLTGFKRYFSSYTEFLTVEICQNDDEFKRYTYRSLIKSPFVYHLVWRVYATGFWFPT